MSFFFNFGWHKSYMWILTIIILLKKTERSILCCIVDAWMRLVPGEINHVMGGPLLYREALSQASLEGH